MVGFDESNICLNHWACVFDPPSLGFFVCLYITIVKVLDVGLQHILLVAVCSIFEGVSEILRNASQDAT